MLAAAATTAGAVLPAATGGAAPASAGGGVKDLLHGLTTIAGRPKRGYPINNQVILVSWAQLEPSRGRFTLSPIDSQLSKARAGHWNVKLRVMAGLRAPEWVKNIGGRPWSYRNGSGKVVGTIGRFWSPEYGAEYGRMMQRLAAAYDTDPVVREVALSRCMTEFAEPLWREFSRVAANVAAARAAGYTDTADKACQRAQIVSDGAPWKHTHVDLALSGAQYIGSNGRPYGDSKAPMENLALLKQTFGSRGIPENNQLSSDKTANSLYRAIATSSPPSTFQVETYSKLRPHGVPGLLAALHMGCDVMDANSVELPTGYDHASSAQLTPFARSCASN